jgi:drug/metabolite transporter (DMT)-like permease
MPQLNLLTSLYFVITTALWAGNAIAGRLLVGSVSPITLSAVRWGLAGILLLPWSWRILSQGSPLWQNKFRFLVLGLFGIGSYNALLYLALQTSSPINVTLIGASMPIWMLLIGAIFYQVRPNILQMIGAIVSLFGVTIVLTRGDVTTLASMQLVRGDLLIMLATILWAAYSWMLTKPGQSTEKQWAWSDFLMAQIFVGFLWTLLFDGFEIASGNAYIHFSWKTAGLLLFMAIGPSLISYRLWGVGVSRAGPTVAAFFANLIPLFTALLSALLLGEPPRLFHGLAFALIAAGIIASSTKSESQAVKSP